MTKEALDRIKEAYYSGLKVQIWFNGHWENFDTRDYPINTDPFSEHRLYRIVGSAYVDIAEKQIADLKKENAELERKLEQTEKDLTDYQFNYPKILDLEKENAELKEKLNRHKHGCPSCTAFGKHCPHKVKGDPYFYDCYLTVIELEQENATLKKQLEALSGDIPWNKLKDVSEVTKELTEAREIIEEYVSLDYVQLSPSDKVIDLRDRAEQFISEVEK